MEGEGCDRDLINQTVEANRPEGHFKFFRVWIFFLTVLMRRSIKHTLTPLPSHLIPQKATKSRYNGLQLIFFPFLLKIHWFGLSPQTLYILLRSR